MSDEKQRRKAYRKAMGKLIKASRALTDAYCIATEAGLLFEESLDDLAERVEGIGAHYRAQLYETQGKNNERRCNR